MKIQQLFIFIDSVLMLPTDLDLSFREEVKELIKGAKPMGLSWDTTNIAQIYKREGLKEGLEKGEKKRQLKSPKNGKGRYRFRIYR